MSANCCNKTLKLGCFLCGQPGVKMPFNAPSTGTYSAIFQNDDNACVFQFEAVEGEPVIVPIAGLNENFTHRFYLLDENETLIEYEAPDSTTYDCFQVRLTPSMPGEAHKISLSGVTCENLLDPTTGLTKQQKEGCVLPSIDMETAPLTDEQEAALMSRLCDAQECDPVAIRTTRQEEITVVEAGGNYDLPQVRIPFVQSNGDEGATIGPFNAGFESPNIVPETVLARFVVRTTDGATPIAYGDVVNPLVNIPSTRIRFKDDLDESQVTGPLSTGYSSGSLYPEGEVPRRELTLNGVGTGLFATLERLILGTIPDITTPTPSGIRYAISQTMWSGVEAVYATGDEGHMNANAFFDYVGPSLPAHTARLVDWFTLYENNVFGNTNRFTDRDGLQVYSDRIIMDHFTGLEWYSPSSALTGTWSVAIAAGVALNYGGHTDWRVPPLGVLQTIIRTVTGQLLNYAPFNIPATTVWSSTTNVQSTTNAIPMITSGTFQSTAKSGSGRYFFVRRFA